MIPFNKPYMTGKETQYISDAVQNGKISGNGVFTKKCHQFFREKYGFKNCLLTTSCTDALEMAAILCDIKPGDEVIIPSYTFVSTCNAFVMRGAKVVFADSKTNHPNIDETKIESLITPKTKAIIVVHYAGIACNMDAISDLCKKHNIFLIEDAAQAIDSFYKNRPCGSFGDLATFSFHETKNLISGEGGLLVINNDSFIRRAEIIWEKGTNRAAFFRGEINKYEWVDIGSSFLPSEIIAAFLFAQLENLESIQHKRKEIYNRYQDHLSKLNQNLFALPSIMEHSTNNAHIYYLVFNNLDVRTDFIKFMKENGIHTVFHYLSLHKSKFFRNYQNEDKELVNSDRFENCLVRLPLFFELTLVQQTYIIDKINEFVLLEGGS